MSFMGWLTDTSPRPKQAIVAELVKGSVEHRVSVSQLMNDTTTPKVGDGATISGWTDSYACTVIAVNKTGTRATLQEDHAKLLNGSKSGEPDALVVESGGFYGHTSGVQRYEYTRNPEGTIYRVSLRTLKDGSKEWKRVGTPTKRQGGSASMGERYRHYDYNF